MLEISVRVTLGDSRASRARSPAAKTPTPDSQICADAIITYLTQAITTS
jgi:hypothetical protein